MADRPESGSRQHSRRRYSQDEMLLLKRLESSSKQPSSAAPAEDQHLEEEPPPASRSRAPGRDSPLRGCYRLLRWTTRVITWLYLLGFVLLMCGFHQWGQGNLTTATLMYLPQWAIIVPALLLLLPVLVFDWKTLPFLLAACAFFGYAHLGFRFGPPARDASGLKGLATLRVMTWNRGQGKGASLQVIKKELFPDMVLLQDSVGKATYYKTTPEYSEFTDISGAGEFVMLSRWPILSVELLGADRARAGTGVGTFNQGRAARFVVLAAGARCAVYNIHLQTPRGALEASKRGAFLYGILGFPGSPWEEKKKTYQAFWDEQMRIAREIAERIRAETIPVIVCGDFNTPAFGPIYADFAKQLQDAHLIAGTGCGYTFPGDTGNPFALFQPWLRLDQMFASQHWEVRRCETIEVKAQHFPVVSEFHLLPQFRLMGQGGAETSMPPDATSAPSDAAPPSDPP